MYDNLASGAVAGTFTPEELFAGESDIVSTNEVISSAVAGVVAKYTVMGKRADGKIVPMAPFTSDGEGKIFASGTLTFGGQPTADDTLTINGVAITFKASGATGNQVNIGGSATLTAQAVKTFLNANVATFGVNATGAATVLSLTAETAGLAGNSLTLAKSGTYPSLSAATLTGGADNAGEAAKESVAYCITAAAADATSADANVPVFIGGVFNHAALVWPASLNTEQLRRMAFQGTQISVKALK